MSSKNEPDEVDFSLKLDDDLLAAALQAVEKRMGDSRQRSAELDDPEEAGDVAVFFDEDAEGSVELDLDLDTLDMAPSTESAAEDPGLTARLAELEDQLELAREQTDTARQDALRARKAASGLRAEHEKIQEESRRGRDIVLKQGQRLKRLTEELGRAKLKLEDSEAKVREWEKLLGEARGTLRQQEQDRERSRTRHTRELQEAGSFASERSFKELLPVLDHMDLALAHAASDPERLVEGIQMILAQLVGTLRRQGLEKIEPGPGSPFDPALHEAMKNVHSLEVGAGQVLDLLQPGYVLHDRLLRPARVSVSSGPLMDDAEVPAERDGEGAEGLDSEE